MHYRRPVDITPKTPGNRLNVEGDITEHAKEIIRAARLRPQPGKTAFQIAKTVAVTTAEDFMKKGAVLESDFVKEVHDEIVRLESVHRSHREALAAFQDLEDARADSDGWEPPAGSPDQAETVLDVAGFFDEFETELDEDAARRRHWRETYAMLEPLERRVFLVGVAGSGVVLVSIVSAITQALL